MATKTVPGAKPAPDRSNVVDIAQTSEREQLDRLRKAHGGIADGIAAISYLCSAVQASDEEMGNFQIAIEAITRAMDVHVGEASACMDRLPTGVAA